MLPTPLEVIKLMKRQSRNKSEKEKEFNKTQKTGSCRRCQCLADASKVRMQECL